MKSKETIYSLLLIAFIFLLPGVHICNGQVVQTEIQKNSVRDFGAKGDSITDDTEAIQKAIDSGVGQINFPRGTYRLTHSIVIDLDKLGPVTLSGQSTARILMEGAGPAFKFVGTHEGTADPSTVKQNVWQSQRMPVVDGLEIVGHHPKAVGVEATGTMQLTITRVLVREALHGIHLTKRNRNVIITNSHVYHNEGIGIYLDKVDLHQINVTSSHISYNGGGGVVVRGGQVRNLQIGSSDIEGNMDKGKPSTANILIDMSEGGVMREGAITGCTIQHTGDAPESANIRFVGHETENWKKTGNFIIANNFISDAQYNIHIQHSRALEIADNNFGRGFTNNILIQQSDHINIGSNMMDRNPDYGPSTADTKNNIIIQGSKNLTINGLHLYHAGGSAGIVLDRCRNYNITNSTILNSNGVGILLKNTETGKVSGNFINSDRQDKKNSIAIEVQGGEDNLITNNYTHGAINGESDAAKVVNNYSYSIKYE